MKIAFFGTSDRSSNILDSLKENFELMLCVTKTDSKIGRHQINKETGVKTWAKENKVDFVEINNLKGDDLIKVLESLKNHTVEYGIVADFSLLIPEEIIEYFNKKLINIHFSLLPNYRGASPVQFSILDGEKRFGITYMLVEKGLDTGDILKEFEYKLPDNTTTGEAYDLLFKKAGYDIVEVLEQYSKNNIAPLPQDHEKATYTFSPSNPKSTFIFKEDAHINWKESMDVIDRKIRAFNPWPIAWGYLRDLENVELNGIQIHFKSSVNKELKYKIYSVDLSDNKINIKEIQVEGKNRTDWKSFKNGYLA